MNAYEINQLASRIEVGDTVKLVTTARMGERNWNIVPYGRMDYLVGHCFEVGEVHPFYGVLLEGIIEGTVYFLWVPYFVLEIVKKGN